MNYKNMKYGDFKKTLEYRLADVVYIYNPPEDRLDEMKIDSVFIEAGIMSITLRD